MAAIDTTRPTYAAPSFTASLAARVAAIFGALIEWNDARVTRNALNELTDRELNDIGMGRGDIDEVVIRKPA